MRVQSARRFSQDSCQSLHYNSLQGRQRSGVINNVKCTVYSLQGGVQYSSSLYYYTVFINQIIVSGNDMFCS